MDRADDNSYTLHRHLIGYVLHHVDVSAVDFVRRAAMVGISNGNTHDDKEIVYVNRYDWVSVVNYHFFGFPSISF